MQIDRISGIFVESTISRSLQRVNASLSIPGGRSQFFGKGVDVQAFTLKCYFNSATAKTNYLQLQEIYENPDWKPTYVQFDGSEAENDGWYVIDSLRADREQWEGATYYPFDLTLRKTATQQSHRQATFWDQWTSAAESYSFWSGLSTNKLIGLPYNVTNVATTVNSTRTGSDGSNQVLVNPTRQTVLYTSSSTIADWYKSDCRVYDSVVAADTTEANWVQVFSELHNFTGDTIIQNGLLRYKFTTTGTFFVWDSVSAQTGWVSVGTWLTALTGDLNATIKHFGLLKVTPEFVKWEELRQNSVDPIKLTYTLRRGCYHCRVVWNTYSKGFDTSTYFQLAQTTAYTVFGNPAVTGAAGAGNLVTATAANYEIGWSTARNIIAGFVLTQQPSGQPIDPGASGNYIPLSITAGLSQTGTIAVLAFPSQTTGIDITGVRASALAISQEALYHVDSRGILIEKTTYS